jgi:hypothetical protein
MRHAAKRRGGNQDFFSLAADRLLNQSGFKGVVSPNSEKLEA